MGHVLVSMWMVIVKYVCVSMLGGLFRVLIVGWSWMCRLKHRTLLRCVCVCVCVFATVMCQDVYTEECTQTWLKPCAFSHIFCLYGYTYTYIVPMHCNRCNGYVYLCTSHTTERCMHESSNLILYKSWKKFALSDTHTHTSAKQKAAQSHKLKMP